MPVWLQLIPALSQLLERLIPDPQARANAKLALTQAENAQVLQEFQSALQADATQAQVDQQEASSENLFVSGWRPFIGWVCGGAFAYHFILQPLLAFFILNTGSKVNLPDFDMQQLSTVLMGMLGLGGLRTIEKINAR
ncbi:MAG: holin family protein [Pseudomonadota bacterium]|nr:holin family protein [Pseudomonadota bacterium]